MIEITFKGADLAALRMALAAFLDSSTPVIIERTEPAPSKPEKKPEPKQLPKAAIDAAERMAKARAAKAKKKVLEPTDLSVIPKGAKPVASKPQELPPSDPRSSDEAWEEDKQARLEGPDPFDEPEPIDPVNLAALRVKTTEDLQAAYSGGKHKQVMALLSKYGNGAKSFRELRIEDFVPIRKAIDEGALA